MIYDARGNVFADAIYPEFPFKKNDWLAIAFERDRYDATRLPDWFFHRLMDVFNQKKVQTLSIRGDCFPEELIESGNNIVAFEWDVYQQFMLLNAVSCFEVWFTSEDELVACWSDAELSVIGGRSSEFEAVLETVGGRDGAYHLMVDEFLLGETKGNDDMREYFRRLLSL